ncbi:YfdQ family protein, partial [Shewanella sp. A25]|nr:YfdQ family protein [Shewanella shenzhenensis]
TAIVDYHAPDKAAHGAHVAAMALPYSEEWKAWTAIDGKLMPQREFARFIEENAVDVVAPSGADLLEVVRDLQAVRKV